MLDLIPTINISNKTPTQRIATNDKEVTFEVYDSIFKCEENWSQIVPLENAFLSVAYLNVLERSSPKELKFRYVIYYQNDTPIGLVYFQNTHFYAAESIDLSSVNSGWKLRLKKMVAQHIALHTLICGNLFLTGSHGFYFKDERLMARQLGFVEQAMRYIAICLEQETSQPIKGFFIKDIQPTPSTGAMLLEQGYHRFNFEPSMGMDIPSNWKSFENYLEALTSKYRVRYRRTRKLLGGIIRTELSGQDVKNLSNQLYRLYRSISETADFNFVHLERDYFTYLAEAMPDKFRVFGYWLEQELVGFCTCLMNGSILEAHFLGFDQVINRTHHLYHNMLFDILAIGLDNACTSINFSRTALEIKSSVGAHPTVFQSYIRHADCLPNKFLSYFFNILSPEQDWQPRHPFK